MSKKFVVLNNRDEFGLVKPAVLNLFNKIDLGSLATVNPDSSDVLPEN